MGKASSAKKIKRVQQAGVSRAAGQRRAFGYPALIGGIIIVGILLVFFARQSIVSSDEVAPTTDDSWHVAFGLNVCGEFQDQLENVTKDTTGIHIHDDGLIAVHPKNAESAGTNATFGKFAESVGLTVTDTAITLPDGTTKTNGDKCEDQDGRVALVVWPPQANENTEPRVITQNINTTPFTEDGQIFELVFDSRGAENKLPPSVSTLSDPDTKEPADPASSATTTTAPGETTTVPAETTTTAGG